MPEGDTLYKAAATLSVMQGQTVTAFESPLPALASADVIGATITAVESRGKNLLMWFDGSHAIYTHLRMEGSWHLYRPGTPWRKPARRARVVVTTPEWQAVCFNAPTVEWLTAWQVTHHPVLSTLGPDLLAGDDIEAMITALEATRSAPSAKPSWTSASSPASATSTRASSSSSSASTPSPPSKTTAKTPSSPPRSRPQMDAPQPRRRPPPRRPLGPDRQRTWVYDRQGDLCAQCNTPSRCAARAPRPLDLLLPAVSGGQPARQATPVATRPEPPPRRHRARPERRD
ncbi:MAG: DNA-formamidopyrimidine glycosylase family protein [bacterium]